MADQPIGIFDSGVGGLTVVRSLFDDLPHERVVYFGDTARVPYGTKSAKTVIRYARAAARRLLDKDVKLLVIACNTASAFALDALQEELDIPVLGVVEPGSRAAVAATSNGRVGVVGTPSTIASGQYQQTLSTLAPDLEVFCKPCPLFVPLAEEGWTEGEVPLRAAETYLRELLEADIDTLLLGCTHYPLLRDVISKVTGEGVRVVDSAGATAETVADVLRGLGDSVSSDDTPGHLFLVSDSPEAFQRVGEQFLGRPIPAAEWIEF